MRRVHDDPDPGDGPRVLVDRLRSRGLTKDAATFHTWMRDVAPSHALRRWYGHDPVRFPEFADGIGLNWLIRRTQPR